MRPNTRKHYNNKNNNNRYRNNKGGGYRGKHSHDGSDDNVSPQQKRHASNQQGKYLDLAKNAKQNGDRVEAEYYMQHADHYTRILNLAQEQYEAREEAKQKSRDDRNQSDDDMDDNEEDDTQDDSNDDKPKRAPRARRTPYKDRSPKEDVTDAAEDDTPKPKRRGRPRKNPAPEETDSGASLQSVLPIATPEE